MNTVDLSSLDTARAAEAGEVCTLTNPVTGESLGVEIMVVGADSATYRKTRNTAFKRAMASKRKGVDLDAAEREECDVLAACTLSWSGVVVDGVEIPFSAQAAVDLYRRFLWIREQVSAFIGDRANFLPKSKEN